MFKYFGHQKEEDHLPVDPKLPIDPNNKVATFALGWFWFPESQYGAVEGVIRTRVGYCGGKKIHPSYHDISDHSESVQIEYDPNRVTYEKLVSLFWDFHNPTYRSSRQYRSAIFYHNTEQEQAAKKSRDEKQRQLGTTIRSDIEPVTEFTCAEDYHQKYKLQAHSNIMKALNVKTFDDLINSPVACKMNGYLGGYGKVASLKQDIKILKIPEGVADRLIAIVERSSGPDGYCSMRN